MYIIFFFVGVIGVHMIDEDNRSGSMAECGACRELIPIDSSQCPACGVSFSGISDEAMGECGACNKLVPIDSTKCPECGVVFVADDVVDVLRSWLSKTGISVLQLFERFDVDGNGIIDSDELRNGLLDLNLADLPPSQVQRLVEVIDENGDGEIDLGELEVIIEGEHAKELGYAESVLNRVMSSFNIENKDDFLEFASKMNEDENQYLKESELKKAATLYVQNESPVVEGDAKEGHRASTEEEIEGELGHEEELSIEDEHDEEESVSEVEPEIEEHGEMQSTDETDEASPVDDSDDNDDWTDEEEEFGDEEEIHADGGDEDADDGTDNEEDEVSDEVNFVQGIHKKAAFEKLIALMDDEGVSVSRFFNNLDKNGDGQLSHEELISAIQNELDGVLSEDDITDLMAGLDQDGDGKIDLHEFIQSIEEFDEQIEAEELKAKKEKEFPTVWQRRFMSKSWNDIMYPILHTMFGLLIVLLLVNALVGPVDGSGGLVAQETESGSHPIGLYESRLDGTIYPCDKDIQIGGCANSLTPLAGEASSMPKGFYWDGILGLILSVAGLISSITLHFVLAPSWRARMRAMKEVQDDHAHARDFDDAFVKLGELMVEQNLTIREVFEAMDADKNKEIDGPEFQKGLESIAGDSLSPYHVQAILEALDEDGSGKIDAKEFIDAILALDMGIRSDYEKHDDGEQEDDILEDDFQIGDYIGLVLYDEDGEEEEEVYGTIVEFDDDEGTVTIEEDETGDEITGYTEDAFFPEE